MTDLTTGPDTPEAIAQRRADLLAATGWTIPEGTRAEWTPCAGVGQPLQGVGFLTDNRGRRMAYGWCSTCADLVGGKWTHGSKSKPRSDGEVLARRHKDKRPR